MLLEKIKKRLINLLPWLIGIGLMVLLAFLVWIMAEYGLIDSTPTNSTRIIMDGGFYSYL